MPGRLTPPMPDSQEEEAAWERMRTQLRNSSLGMPAPVSRRREYRNSSVPTIDPPSQSPPVEESRAAQQASETTTPAPPLTSAFSPATISTTHMSPVVHAVPLSARVVERTNVMWVNGALTRVMVVGEIHLTMLAAGPTSGRARIKITHADQLEKVAAHPDVLAEVAGRISVGELDDVAADSANRLLRLSPDSAAEHVAVLRDPFRGLIGGAVDVASLETLVALRRRFLPAPQLDDLNARFDELVREEVLTG